MNDDFVWPSDRARAENDELDRVCEYLEEVLDEQAARASGDDSVAVSMHLVGRRKAESIGEPMGVIVRNEAGGLAAVTDLGRVTWLDDCVAGPMGHIRGVTKKAGGEQCL